MDQKGKFPNGLDAAMTAAHIGPTELARAIKTAKQNISRWREQSRKLPTEFAVKIGRHLNIPTEDVLLPAELRPGRKGPRAIAHVDGRRITKNLTPGAIPEIDTFLGGGGGGYPLPEQISENQRTYSADAVRDEWVFPERFVRDELRLHLASIDIVPVRSDSMETDKYGGFRDGDRVLVDRRDHNIRQGGIFAIRDGDETIIKQVELIRGSDPVRIKCTSLNPRYGPFELVLDGSADLIGRVVLKISRT